ncbi:MAG: MaoC/PaaZ C-terminal domain-containing protein [Dehalococcoidia bacterium]|jgi:acyl dehydratase|nr:MaoC/PaaZ C-terminal domain-containing protein [Dehalococcoidia bacterium]MDP7469368.1 MaoC/PaaZ C-terminal domain-containing protein [Dehalococcoidia bacterium]
MTGIPKDVGVGYELPTVSKEVTLKKMRAYSGWPHRNIHTDDEVARHAGLPGAVCQGTQHLSYLSEVLKRFFGEYWMRGGKLSVTFIGLVMPGDVLTPRAIVREKVPEDEGWCLNLEVWMENQRGERVVVGTASARMPS